MTDTANPEKAISQWLRSLSRHGGTALRWAMALPLVGGALLVAQAYLLADLLHRAVVDHQTWATLGSRVALLGLVLLTRMLIAVIAEVLAVRAAEAIKARLRQTLGRHLLDQAPTWTAARSSGALSSAMIEQSEALDGYFVRYLPAMVQATVLPLAFAAVALPIDWMVALIFLFTAPLIPVFMALAGLGAEAAGKAQASALSRLSGRFADRIRGLTTLKLFGRADAETVAVRSASEELRLRTMRVMRIAFLSSAVLEFFAALGVAGVALYIGLTLLDLVSLRGSELTLRAGLFCLLMAPEVYQPLRLLAAHYHDRANAKAAAAEIAAQFGRWPNTGGAISVIPASPVKPARVAGLELVGVSITTPGGRSVMHDANLAVEPGVHVAILGASGIGKSTTLEAIAGLREFGGSILIDQTPLGEIAESDLRQRIAMLGQRPRIFAGSIADNIRLGRRDACHVAVRLAAQRACVTGFADALPNGLATVIGDNGLGLSGGEIQRIALARIYLRDPALILLDEPTAHLDSMTETMVLDGLLDFAIGRTLLVATHAPVVAARMDKVFRIAGGRILPAPRPVLAANQRGAA
ncbi:ATP-binding cassette subfamily C protein CydD [Devosia sp. UYZn731]|uniref:thiol reductant ABC exporter subunit CydD n=1 Tax=Devosia sp. UYZn731 TaxID=3156345 RepID=UPI003390F89E